MFVTNTVKHSSGQVLTGKLWRKEHPFLSDLPFHSSILQMDAMGEGLETALDPSSVDKGHGALLVVRKTHLIYPLI